MRIGLIVVSRLLMSGSGLGRMAAKVGIWIGLADQAGKLRQRVVRALLMTRMVIIPIIGRKRPVTVTIRHVISHPLRRRQTHAT